MPHRDDSPDDAGPSRVVFMTARAGARDEERAQALRLLEGHLEAGVAFLEARELRVGQAREGCVAEVCGDET